MKTFITSIILFFGVSFSLANAAPLNLNGKGVAIKGYDPVSYFVTGQATKGNASFTAEHEGATYHFSSDVNRNLFIKSPERYSPAYGGYCAYGVSIGKLIKIDPKVFTIHNGRLLLQFNKSVAKKYAKDLKTNVALSDKNWPHLK